MNSPREEDFAIWWTHDDVLEQIGRADKLPAAVPAYIRSAYNARLGRVGRGRLWSDTGMPKETTKWPDNSITRLAADNYGGIVIYLRDAHTVAPLPGFLTTRDMQWLTLPPPSN